MGHNGADERRKMLIKVSWLQGLCGCGKGFGICDFLQNFQGNRPFLSFTHGHSTDSSADRQADIFVASG